MSQQGQRREPADVPVDPAIRAAARPLEAPEDLDGLLDRIADARYVLLGEASHGTAEYYRWRAVITRRLIAERSFGLVAVEGDWPDCWRLNRWVKGAPDAPAGTPREVLRGFERWPTWMWANEEVADFLGWLQDHNATLPQGRRVGFYGLDVYSLWESMEAVMAYLRQHDPSALDAAGRAWRCFEPFAEDPQEYAWATRLVPESCEDEVVGLLCELRRRPAQAGDAEARFAAQQNALVAVDAERYYRAMVHSDSRSWNIRDVHMADTLDRLVAHHGDATKAVVWAHNTHVGDARATDMAAAGMVNLGQLVRERHAADGVVLVGFAGFRGSVIAGSFWGAPAERMPVPPAGPGSVEDVLHRALGRPSVLVFPPDGGAWLRASRPHRAIGVVYNPEFERRGNYVPTVLGRRYDALLSFDTTEALHPLQPAAARTGEPQAWPSGQ